MASGHDHKSRPQEVDDKMDDDEDRSSPGQQAADDTDDEKGRESPSRGADDSQENNKDEADDTTGSDDNQNDETGETRPETEQEYAKLEPQSDNPDEFDSRSFLSRVSHLHAKLQADNLKHVDEDFPADELANMVNTVTSTMNSFKQYAMHTQQELEHVRGLMKEIKERVYKRIQAKGYDPKSAQEKKGLEERELEAKVAQLNKEIAKSAEELVRASQISADTEAAAAEASLVAEQAAAEALRIQAEYEARKKADLEARRIEEEKREAARKRREEEEKRQEEVRLAEEAKIAKLRKPEEQKAPDWEKWPTFTYNTKGGEFTQGIGCIIRGDPDSYRENMVRVELVDPLEKKSLLAENEELVSDVITLVPTQDDQELQGTIYVAVPHCTSRASAISREPVVKAEVEDGKWEELKGQEITFENNKDVKFVQAEVKLFTSLCVVTRYKRDFLYFSKKGGKVSSNVDARVTFSTDRGTFKKPEHFILQLQPIDSATISRVKERSAEASKLLTSSYMVNMSWTSEKFDQPVTMTLPCPPNPVKAKKAAAARAAKEAKMKNPQPPGMARLDDEPRRAERKKAKTTKRGKQTMDDDDDDNARPGTASVTKWYMGQYGNDEDDENDLLYFLKKMPNNKWCVLEHMTVLQVKLDLLQLRFAEPIETFMVLRTRTNADVRDAQVLAETIETCLKERVVGVVLRQKQDNQCDVVMTVVPTGRLDKVLSQLDDEGYESGTVSNQKDAAIKNLNEGDTLEVIFTGNVKCQDAKHKLEFAFHSQLVSQMNFSIIEVDKYLQKGYSEFRGFVELQKKYEVIHMPPKTAKKDEGEAETGPRIEIKHEIVSKHMVKIPKEDENSPRPLKKAPIKITNSDYSLDDDTVRHVAQSLGDEWTRVAHYLNVRKQRLQAIMRNNNSGEEEDVKYEMLMTWMKKVPRSANKTEILVSALLYSNRPDLVGELREQEHEYQDRRRSGLASRMSRRISQDRVSIKSETPRNGDMKRTNNGRPSSGGGKKRTNEERPSSGGGNKQSNEDRPRSGASIRSAKSGGSVRSESARSVQEE